MLQQEQPDDYVVATNETHTVSEFAATAFAHAGLDWREYVVHNPQYDRPAEVDLLLGDYAKAKRVLHWEPKIRMKELAQMMVEEDLKLARQEAILKQ